MLRGDAMARKRILISADELRSKLDQSDWVAVDCRFNLGDPTAGRRAYLTGHLPGAVYFDLDQDLAGPVRPDTGRHPLPDAESFMALLGSAGIGNEHHVVVYDGGSGGVAARAWWLMHWLGHDRVRLLDGGFAQWQALGYPIEAEVSSRTPTIFHGKPHPELVISTDELACDPAAIAGKNLFDARDGARFSGAQEPIDAVAGHVPGAKNVPFGDFVSSDGTWLSLPEREDRLVNALGGDRHADWSVMCGSGVTACHLVISALEAGLSEPRLYVGSWSEWIRDADRPVVLEENG
jgi:thiosulfate/3-mercaptopyruvate sulfurtransferase